LKGSGVALGVNEAFDYKENNRRGLTNGQIIAIGTDGIWEAINKEGQMFGKERFRQYHPKKCPSSRRRHFKCRLPRAQSIYPGAAIRGRHHAGGYKNR